MVKQGVKSKLKIILPIIVGIIVVIAALVVGVNYLNEKESQERLITVQNGYLGNYNMVTVKEVLEETWKNGIWDSYDTEGKHIVEYVDEKYGKIQIAIKDDEEIFQVAHLKVDEKVMETPIDVKRYLDSIYGAFGEAYPERGVILDSSLENNTVFGSKGPVLTLNLITLKDPKLDLATYLDTTIEEMLNQINIGVILDDEGLSYINSNESITIMKNDEEKMGLITLKEDSDNTPPIFGVKIGENSSTIEKLLEKQFTMVSEQINADENKVIIELWRNNTDDSMSITYSLKDDRIIEINYIVDLIDDDMKKDIQLRKSVDVDERIQIVKDSTMEVKNINNTFNEIFGDSGKWSGVAQNGGDAIVTYRVDDSEDEIQFVLEVDFMVSQDNSVVLYNGTASYIEGKEKYEEVLLSVEDLNDFIGALLEAINAQNQDFNYLLGDWTSGGDVFYEGYILTVTNVKGNQVTFNVMNFYEGEQISSLTNIEGSIEENRIDFIFDADSWGNGGYGSIFVLPKEEYSIELHIEVMNYSDYALGSIATNGPIKLYNIELAEQMGIVGD